MTFDPLLVLDSDPRTRARNSYEAILSYAQARLSASDYTVLQGQLTTAGLPLTSSGLNTVPNPWEYVSGLRDIVFSFVSGFAINPTTISGAAATNNTNVTVAGNLDVEGVLTAASMVLQGGLVLGGSLSASVAAAITGDVVVSGNIAASGGVRAGSLIGVAAGTVSAEERIEAGSFRYTSTQTPATAPNGTIGEDANGDIFWKDLAGAIKHLKRPNHDTGWLPINPLHPSIGLSGTSAPTPGSTPDIYAMTPMIFAGLPGDPGGPARIVVWVRADDSLILGGAPSGNFYYTPVVPYEGPSNVLRGVQVTVDQATLQLSISISPSELVPGQPLITTGAAAGLVDIRVFVWIR